MTGHHETPAIAGTPSLDWRAVMDGLGFGVFVLDARQHLVFGNELYRGMTGYDITECGGVEAWFRKLCPDEQEADEVVASWRHHLWRNQMTRIYGITTADGRGKRIEFRASEGPGDGLVVTMRDVTQDSRTEERLREGKMKFRAVFGRSATGIALTDASGRIADVNEAFVELCGISLQELRLTPFSSLLHPQDAERLGKREEELLSRSRIRPDDSVTERVGLRTRDGQRPVDVTFCPVGADGRAMGIYLFDALADRGVAEAARRKIAELSRKARALLEAVPDLIVLIDREGVVVDVSPPPKPWAELSVSPGWKGRPVAEAWTPLGALFERSAGRIFDEGKTVSAQLHPGAKRGSFAVSLSPFGDELILATVRNLSAQRHFEERIVAYREAVDRCEEAVLVCDARGEVEEANETARRWFDIDPGENDGEGKPPPLPVLLGEPEESAGAWLRRVGASQGTDGFWRDRRGIAIRGGGTREVDVTLLSPRHQGRPVGWIAVMRETGSAMEEVGPVPEPAAEPGDVVRFRSALQTVTSLFALEPQGREARSAFVKWQVRLRALAHVVHLPGTGFVPVASLVRGIVDDAASVCGRGPGSRLVSVSSDGDLAIDGATAMPFALLMGELVRLAATGPPRRPGPAMILAFSAKAGGRIQLLASPGDGGRLFEHAEADEAATLDLLAREIRGILRTRNDERGAGLFELTFRADAGE